MKLLVINPGSTSTKISLYEGRELLFEDSVFHDAPVLLQYGTVNEQMPFRRRVIEDLLEEKGYLLGDVDVFVGRGGSAQTQPSGVTVIDGKLYEDTKNAVGGSEHAAKLGVMLAYELGTELGKPMYTLNPTNVDELCDYARVTVYPNELEQEELAGQVMDVLEAKAEARTYSGEPVWQGFDFGGK